jgi:D-alanine-D-alanine ligase
LGCDGLTRSDFILHDQALYFLEINTIPGQTEVSLAPKAAKAIGLSFSDFLDKQIEMALQKWTN